GRARAHSKNTRDQRPSPPKPARDKLRAVSEPAIAVEDLRKTYRGRGSAPPIEALRGISFTVSPGEVLGLRERNGAGKSSTVRIVTTLSRATAGAARVAGFDVER